MTKPCSKSKNSICNQTPKGLTRHMISIYDSTMSNCHLWHDFNLRVDLQEVRTILETQPLKYSEVWAAYAIIQEEKSYLRAWERMPRVEAAACIHARLHSDSKCPQSYIDFSFLLINVVACCNNVIFFFYWFLVAFTSCIPFPFISPSFHIPLSLKPPYLKIKLN